MKAKFIMFSISELKYDRLRVSSSEVELDITEKVNAIVKLAKSKKYLVRINVKINVSPVLRTDVDKPMIVLSTDSDYEFYEEPPKEDITPYVVKAINDTRKSLNAITKTIGINPLELDELSIAEFEQT